MADFYLLGEKVREFVWTDNRNGGIVVWYDSDGKRLEVIPEDGLLSTARKQAEQQWTT